MTNSRPHFVRKKFLSVFRTVNGEGWIILKPSAEVVYFSFLSDMAMFLVKYNAG